MRFWEIDFFRGLAVVLMVLFNYSFALFYFGIYTISSSQFFWFWFPRIVAGMFIFIAGISFAVSHSKRKGRNSKVCKKYLLRGGKLFGLGLLITATTYIFAPQGTIFFGILHFIGIATMLLLVFRNLGAANLLFGIIFVLTGIYLQSVAVHYPWLLWLGLAPENFYTFDYFPIFPWLGLMLIGVFTGNKLYANGKRKFRMPKEQKAAKLLVLIGRHSLAVYLLHQPILMAILYVLGYNLF